MDAPPACLYPMLTPRGGYFNGCCCARCAMPPRKSRRQQQVDRYLYTMFDTNNVVLYVGISLNIATRLGKHVSATWWPDVCRIEVRHLGVMGLRLAEAIERRTILALRPVHNVAGNVRNYV